MADFYHCFKSETGCCLSLTLQKWEPAADINVLWQNVCLCGSLSQQVFVGKTWPQVFTSKAEFSSPHSLLLPHYVLFTPPEAALILPPPFFFLPSFPLSPFLHRTTLTCLPHVSLHPAALFIIPTFACVPLTEILFCLDRRRKTVRRWHPPPASQMDYKRMPRRIQAYWVTWRYVFWKPNQNPFTMETLKAVSLVKHMLCRSKRSV